MSGEMGLSGKNNVVYSNGGRPARPCPIHQRPIHPDTLTKVVYVRERWTREHRDHFMPEVGCPLCFRPELPASGAA